MHYPKTSPEQPSVAHLRAMLGTVTTPHEASFLQNEGRVLAYHANRAQEAHEGFSTTLTAFLLAALVYANPPADDAVTEIDGPDDVIVLVGGKITAGFKQLRSIFEDAQKKHQPYGMYPVKIDARLALTCPWSPK